ncbi:MAG: hypothetical protein JWM19_1451 [Actinomycetia bacterium]|nr:hypothetical protein [Actinomycetes bacterium]
MLTALPDPAPGTVRRTVSLELTPDPDWSAGLRVTATGRDVLIEGAPALGGTTPALDNSKMLRAARMTVTLDGRSRVTAIEGDLAPAVTAGLLGAGAISGFRGRLAGLDELDPWSLESAVLDELPTVRLISGYARMIELPPEMTFGPGRPSPMAGICAGWAPDATADRRAREGLPVVTGTPPAAAIASMTPYFHAEPDPRPRSMRRRRILDLTAQGGGYEVFEYFRDSHFDAGLREGALHEYVVRARVAADDGLTIQHVEVTPLALPFGECPLTAPNAAELTGVATREITRAVRERLRGTRSCTHLNDTLRFLRYVPALAAAISAIGGPVSGP